MVTGYREQRYAQTPRCGDVERVGEQLDDQGEHRKSHKGGREEEEGERSKGSRGEIKLLESRIGGSRKRRWA